MKRKKKIIILVLILPGLILLFLGAILGVSWYKGHVDRTLQSELNTFAGIALTHLNNSINYSPDSDKLSFEDLFSFEDSASILFFDNDPSVSENYSDMNEETFEFIHSRFLQNVKSRETEYLAEALAFWKGMGTVTIESCEYYDPDKKYLKAGIGFENPSRSEADIYIDYASGKVLFPFPTSEYYRAVFQVLIDAGEYSETIPHIFMMECITSQAQFGYPQADDIKTLVEYLIHKDSGNVEISSDGWDALLYSLMDTTLSSEAVMQAQLLCDVLAQKKLVMQAFAEKTSRQLHAITLYNDKRYEEAIAAFSANLVENIPGTLFYIGLCADIAGIKKYPGANMRDICENIRKKADR